MRHQFMETERTGNARPRCCVDERDCQTLSNIIIIAIIYMYNSFKLSAIKAYFKVILKKMYEIKSHRKL